MPIKSKAQRRKFAELLVTGKITPETFEEWNRTAGSKELPERLHPKRAPKKKRGATKRGAKAKRPRRSVATSRLKRRTTKRATPRKRKITTRKRTPKTRKRAARKSGR